MEPIWHLTLASVGRVTIAAGSAGLRRVCLALARPSTARLLLFCAVDDHLHVVFHSARPALYGRDLRRSLRRALPELKLQAPHLKPVESRAHMMRLVGYLLEQPERHGLSTPCSLWEGSCFLDLAGARLLPGFTPMSLARCLPRLKLRDLFRTVGLGCQPLGLASDEQVRSLGPERIVALAASVYLTEGTGRSARQFKARVLGARTCFEVGYKASVIAPYLEISLRSVWRTGAAEVEPGAWRALRRRVALELRARKSV